MIVKQIIISTQSKDRLSRLKGRTGITSWNVLCRWAICFSLSEKTIPSELDYEKNSNVEMSWATFAGENHEIYEALIRARCLEDGLPTDEDTLAKYFRLHLNRGIAYLSGTNVIKSIDDLIKLALAKSQAES